VNNTGDIAPTAWGMMRNDLGDCTLAAFGHAVMAWSAVVRGTPAVIPDVTILAAYSAVSGYSPTRPGSDTGCVVEDVLDYAAKTGIGGHTLTARIAVDPRNLTHLRQSIWTLGVAYLGVELPKTAEQEFDAGLPWSVPRWLAGDTVGGHAIVLVAYDAAFFYAVSWGQLVALEPDFVTTYGDEAFALVSPDWLGPDGRSPGGLALADLMQDLAAVAG